MTLRRWRAASALATACLAIATVVPAAYADPGDVVTFASPDLEDCVQEQLGLDGSLPVPLDRLASLTELSCLWIRIYSLEGLESAANLESLTFESSEFFAYGPDDGGDRAAYLEHYFDPVAALPSLHTINFSNTRLPLGPAPDPLLVPPVRNFTADMYGTTWGQDLNWLAGGDDLTSLTLDFDFPMTDLGPIGSLENLEHLRLIGVADASVAPIGGATALKTLELPEAQATGWTSLASLTQLETVELTGTNVETIEWLGGAHGLADVRLGGTPIANASALVGKPLSRVELDDTSVSEIAWLEALPHARVLSLRGLGLTNLDFLGSLSALESLRIDRNDISTLDAVEGAPVLTELTFSSNSVDDISVLASLPALTTVLFDHNRVTDVSSLSALEKLETWSARVQDGSLPAITACVEQPGTGGTNFDGSHPNLWPDRGIHVPGAYLVPFNGEVTVFGSSDYYPFSVRFTQEVTGYTAPCAWPDGYLPTFSFPSALTAGTTSIVDLSWGTFYDPLNPRYEWRDASGALVTSSYQFRPTTADIGRQITPSARTVISGMQTVRVQGPQLTVYGTHPADATWSFSGPPTVGDGAHLQSDQSWSSTSLTCEWLLDGVTVTTSANCAWVIPSSAAGKQLSGRVTVHRANYKDATYEVPAATVVRPFAKSYAGHVVGTPDVGNTLSLAPLDTDAWSPLPTSRTYQWLRGGVPIAGATSGTYTLQTADAGKVISVEVTGQRAGYRSVTIETSAFPVHRLFTSKPTPTISGTRAVGFTLTVSRGTWSPTPSSYVYRWYRDGIAISGATKASYKATTADGGHKITVKVWAKRSGYTTTGRTSDAVTVLKVLTSKPTPTISGTAKVKSTLTARTGTWGPGTVTKSYQWYRNGKAIVGATKSTYKISVKDAYAKITVKVTGTKSGYAKSSRTSASKTPVGIKYSSCTSLRKDYPGGVAKSSSTKGIRSTTYVSSSLYSLNSSRDADKDGWACE